MRFLKVMVPVVIVGGYLASGAYRSTAIAAFAFILNAIYEINNDR